LLETLNETFNQSLKETPVEGMEIPYEDTSPSTSRPSRLGALDILRVDRLQTNLEDRMELLLGRSMIPSRHVDLGLFVSERPPTADGDDPKVATKKGSLHPGPPCCMHRWKRLFCHNFVINGDKIVTTNTTIVKECEALLQANLFASSFTREAQAINTDEQTIPIAHAPIHVISNIDDSIKLSNILGGAYSGFRNVFA
jgi:hypothetical protein